MFLAESALLGLFSGVAGVLLASGRGRHRLLRDLSPGLAQNAAIGILFGLVTTVIFGVYPANQAARLDPIEALRTE